MSGQCSDAGQHLLGTVVRHPGPACCKFPYSMRDGVPEISICLNYAHASLGPRKERCIVTKLRQPSSLVNYLLSHNRTLKQCSAIKGLSESTERLTIVCKRTALSTRNE